MPKCSSLQCQKSVKNDKEESIENKEESVENNKEEDVENKDENAKNEEEDYVENEEEDNAIYALKSSIML